jgi:hypothetical protein
MRLQEAKSIARHLRLTLRQVRSGDYRVNFRDGNETTAYYTNNLEDAVHTAVEMASSERKGNLTQRKKVNAAVKGLAQVKQDKITIHGPKNDGTYIVEFKTADGVALAFSVPRGGEAAVLEYFQDKMPYGLAVPNVPRTISKSFYWLEPGGRSASRRL